MSTTQARTRVTIVNREGLHARPSQMLVKCAQHFGASIRMRIGGHEADAKSIIELMILASPVGTEVEILATGSDAEEAVEALAKIVRSGFGEELA